MYIMSGFSREQIRSAILTQKPKSEIVEAFGTKIEVRQRSLREVLARQHFEDQAKESASLIIASAYVPGTDVKVFDDTDLDVLVEVPMGSDFSRLVEAMNRLTGSIESAEKNSEKTAQPTK
jgi:hypothetical protein